jgi:hypothetical protein
MACNIPESVNLSVKRYLLFLIVFFLLGCGIDGKEPYALWQTFEAPDGAFHFFYMAPPWLNHKTSSSGHPVMVVDKFSEPLENGLDARIKMSAFSVPGTLPEKLLSARILKLKSMGYTVSVNSNYVNWSGQDGTAIDADDGQFWIYEVIFGYKDGSVIMTIWQKGIIGTEDVKLMRESFGPGSDNGR